MTALPVRQVPTAARQLSRAALRVRPPWQLAEFLRSDVVAGRGVPHGDGQSVLVLPPAVAGDWMMPVLSGWLRRIGYSPHPSAIGLHVDCSNRTMARLLPRVERLAERTGGPVTLLGHSRGGLLSRAVAAARPDLVSRVVALASPLGDPFAISNLTLGAAADLARRRLHRRVELGRLGCLTELCACPYSEAFAQDWPDVPLVSLFTRTDEVVRWQACVVPYARNVEVRGTHLGVLAARNAYVALARALAGELGRARHRLAPDYPRASLRPTLPAVDEGEHVAVHDVHRDDAAGGLHRARAHR